jgi:hypothetical protein
MYAIKENFTNEITLDHKSLYIIDLSLYFNFKNLVLIITFGRLKYIIIYFLKRQVSVAEYISFYFITTSITNNKLKKHVRGSRYNCVRVHLYGNNMLDFSQVL